MPFNVDDFRFQQDGNFAKVTKYNVIFPVPAIMQNSGLYNDMFDTTYNLQFASDSVDLAGVGLVTHNVVRFGYGASEKKAATAQFNDVLITFYNDGTSTNLNYFQTWFGLINNFNLSQGINNYQGNLGAYETNYKDDYCCDGRVTLLDTNGNDVFTIVLRRMFPVQLFETKLGWALIQDIMRVSVMFTYQDWYIDANAGGTLVDQATTFNNQGLIGTPTGPAITPPIVLPIQPNSPVPPAGPGFPL